MACDRFPTEAETFSLPHCGDRSCGFSAREKRELGMKLTMIRHLLLRFICRLLHKAVSDLRDTLYSVKRRDDDNELQRIWKETAMAYCKAVFQQLRLDTK
jgi:hypothetical protein